MKVVLVYNPCSGSAIDPNELRAALNEAGISIVDIIPVRNGYEEKLKKYADQQEVYVAGYGGDGTLSGIAGILANTDTVFIPLPGGTLNHFAKDLGIPQELPAALRSLKLSAPRHIDVATVNGRTFVNNSSIGLYPSLLQMRDEMSRKQTFKWPAAIIAAIKAFMRYRCYVVEIDGERFKTPFVFVGNNDYRLENSLIGNRTALDSGKLCVYSVVAADRWSLLRVLGRAIVGKLKAVDEVKTWKPKTITIETSVSRIWISRDGEYERSTSPLRYEIRHGALTVLGGN